MSRAKLSTTATADMDEIFFYIAEDDLSAAKRLMFELSEKFQLLAENPSIGRIRLELGSGFRSFPYRKYLIFYITTDYGVEIDRVLHSARDVESEFEM